MKTCSRCKIHKALEDFYRRPASKDGLMSHCKLCDKERQRRFNAANPGKAAKRQQRWREENPEARRKQTQRHYAKNAPKRMQEWNERSRLYRKMHPEKARAAVRRWAEYNPDKVRTKNRRRRARKAGASIGDSAEIVSREAKIRTEACAHCGTEDNIHVDHIWPLSKGGAHAAFNLQPLCASCNSKKGAKLPLMLEAAA